MAKALDGFAHRLPHLESGNGEAVRGEPAKAEQLPDRVRIQPLEQGLALVAELTYVLQRKRV